MGGVVGRVFAAATLIVLAACGAPAPSTASAVATPATATAEAPTPDAPGHLTYKAIGVDADLEPTGLNPDGTIHVPALDKAAEVDYLNFGADFGKGRPTVLISHVSGRGPAGQVIPGGFIRLSHAKVGDPITVTSMAGAQATYLVSAVKTVLKSQFPTSIYNPTGQPTLQLITCGGQLDRAHGNYLSNVLVTATAARGTT